MTHLLFMDTEQAAIIRIAAEAAAAMLDARARRVDPDRIISESVKMQRLKVAQVLSQLERNVLPLWDELPDAQQLNAVAIMQALASDPARKDASQLWETLIASAMAYRGVQEPPEAAKDGQPASIR